MNCLPLNLPKREERIVKATYAVMLSGPQIEPVAKQIIARNEHDLDVNVNGAFEDVVDHLDAEWSALVNEQGDVPSFMDGFHFSNNRNPQKVEHLDVKLDSKGDIHLTFVLQSIDDNKEQIEKAYSEALLEASQAYRKSLREAYGVSERDIDLVLNMKGKSIFEMDGDVAHREMEKGLLLLKEHQS